MTRPSKRTLDAWARHVGSEVDWRRLLAQLSEGSLPQTFHRVAREAGDRPAVAIDGEQVTYRELDDSVGRLAHWIRDQGVVPRERVVLSGANSVGFVVAYLATLRVQAVAVLADPGLSTRELRHVIGDSGAVAAFASGETHARLAALADEGQLRMVWSLDEGVEHGPQLAPSDARGDATAVFGYTSGTTGVPKGAPLSDSNLLSSLRGIMLAWRFRDDDVLVHALPLCHQHGLSGLQAALLSGARAVVHRGLEPGLLAASIAGDRASILFAVPAVYERLLAWEGRGSADFSSLRLATCGSAPLSPTLWQRVANTLGREPLERFGTTESGLDVSNPYDGPRKPGSVGLPLPGIEVEVRGRDGRPLGDDANGEIVLRGPQVFAGYWRNEDATRQSFYPGGWFRTGDLGCISGSDGYLSITGRLKELIISGGLNVYPREVEIVLEEHPAVARAAVVGVPSDRWGEEVVAFVVSAAGAAVDEREILAYARDLLAPHKRPKAVFAIDALPTTSLGKLRRSALAALAAERQGLPKVT